MLVSTITGEAWEKHLKAKAEAEKKQQEADKKGPARPGPSWKSGGGRPISAWIWKRAGGTRRS